MIASEGALFGLRLEGVSPWLHGLALALGTFLSEDLTCIAAGLLVQDGRMNAGVALSGCLAGIVAGDFALWCVGAIAGPRLLNAPWILSRLPRQRVDALAQWFDRHGWSAVVVARFIPGARLPVYLAAGALGSAAPRFLLWTVLAACVWTPLLVLGVVLAGGPVAQAFEAWTGSAATALAAALAVLFVALRIVEQFGTLRGRQRLWARVSRLWRWEFWPMWLFYAPLAPWIAWLSVRYRGLTTPTAANPGIPHGGVVGESKFDILSRLPPEWVAGFARLGTGDPVHRLAQLQEIMGARGWAWPIVLKPDAGQRGAGVRIATDRASAAHAISAMPAALLAQEHHPGPFEAGVFYVRVPRPEAPHEEVGRIFSITDKVFPMVEGDGVSTVEDLVWRDRRFRMQARTFLARLDGRSDTVPAPGERVRLALAGNHCQGTLFRDGRHLHTPELERTIDRIARCFDGFYFGRFDIRYASSESLRTGRDFKIIELNGVTSESTNIYDPSWSLLRAYGVLARQWELLFRIGAIHRRAGRRATPLVELLREVRRFYAGYDVPTLSD